MKGIIIHPLRLRALDRMTVLRVPFREQPPDDSWFVGIGRSRGNPVAIFQAGATQYPVHLPYAPGEYFVKEGLRASESKRSFCGTYRRWALYKIDNEPVLIGGPAINDGVGWEWMEGRDGTTE